MTRRKHLFFFIVMIFFSAIVALLSAEIMVRLFSPQNLSGSWRIYSERGYLLNKSGGNTRHQLGDRIVLYRFNSYHLRGGPIKENIPRVLVLGDSYTFGWLLKEEDTFVNKLQVYADRAFGNDAIQFLNGGGGGWGISDYLAFLEEFGEKILPKIVIVFLNTDDIGRSIKSQLYTIKDLESLELESRNLSERISSIKKIVNTSPFYQRLLENSHLLQFLRTTYLRFNNGTIFEGHSENKPNGVVLPRSEDIQVSAIYSQTLGQALFRRINQWCETHGAQLLITTTGWHFTNAQKPNNKKYDPTIQFMQKANYIFKNEGIPYKDITPEVTMAMEGHPENFVIAVDGHPNEKGSEVIAKHSWSWLYSNIRIILYGK